ncbi:MAG: hypothetical protein OEY93_08045 [Anaerolineae bacterium]|nr:hypothetical protein [Anaerolineae bacterium]
MTTVRKPVPIYTTKGDFSAFLVYPMLYNLNGEWIGFVTPDRDVYSVYGEYVGWLSNDPRILRKRSYDFSKPKINPPQPPPKMTAPASAPLPPMMAELGYDTIDVLEDEPDRLDTADRNELRPDLE